MSDSDGRKETGIGLIGCGHISDQYLANLTGFPGLKVLACADIDEAKARAKAQRHGVPRAVSVATLLADAEVELVINLTVPNAHADVSLAAIESGKHVYSEKPLATRRKDGAAILEASRRKGVQVGCAPDTFLGGGLQTCRALVDKGVIGRPISATAFMVSRGPEQWHPNPAFFYQEGGGPLLDMGPYYLTALVSLIGPIRRVSGSIGAAFSERTIGSGPLKGHKVGVEVPTHVAGLLEFVSGAIGTIVMSFDVSASDLPRIEIHGTEGTLSGPDPNRFGGPVRVRRAHDAEWREVPLSHPEGGRGLGVAELAASIGSGRRPSVEAELAFHVLDVMQALHESAELGRHITLESTCQQPAQVSVGGVISRMTEQPDANPS